MACTSASTLTPVTVGRTIAEIPAMARVQETACTRAKACMTVTVGPTIADIPPGQGCEKQHVQVQEHGRQ